MGRISQAVFVSAVIVAVAACGSSASPAASSGASAGASAAASSAGGGGTCAKAPDGTTAAATVTMQNFAFAPASVTVKKGEAVSWTNSDTANHTVTMIDGACDAGQVAKGVTVLLTFNDAGTYAYHCTIHQSMTGTVEVTG